MLALPLEHRKERKRMAEDERAAPGSLARKLDRLFRTMHPRGRREYTYEDVAESVAKRGGPTISATYVWLLRTGQRDNPTKHHLEGLADFFGVSPAYFFDDTATARIDAQLDLLTALRDAPVRQIALRAFGLSPGSLRMVADIVTQVRELEGLPDPDEEAALPPGHPPRSAKERALPGAPPPPVSGEFAEEVPDEPATREERDGSPPSTSAV
ncbi:MAG TPA: XRE family transcriptional regulator [Chloroflexota bacterium]|jgi:transcriptional regulator with XRE-family HTH domain